MSNKTTKYLQDALTGVVYAMNTIQNDETTYSQLDEMRFILLNLLEENTIESIGQ